MASRIFILAAFLSLSLFSACCMANDEAARMTDPMETHARFKKALNEHSVEQLLALYSGDCVMVARNGKEIRGKENTRKLLEAWVKGIVHLDIETVYSVRSGDIVLFRSKYHSVYRDAEGKEHAYVSSGIEIVQRQKDGAWQIILDHHSGGANIPMDAPNS